MATEGKGVIETSDRLECSLRIGERHGANILVLMGFSVVLWEVFDLAENTFRGIMSATYSQMVQSIVTYVHTDIKKKERKHTYIRESCRRLTPSSLKCLSRGILLPDTYPRVFPPQSLPIPAGSQPNTACPGEDRTQQTKWGLSTWPLSGDETPMFIQMDCPFLVGFTF